jgi:hypothetical protein
MPQELSLNSILQEKKVGDCDVFPIYCEEFKELVPEVYFGGCEVPAYMHLEMGPDPAIDEIVSAIRSIGSGANSTGYIDDEGIHFHIPDDDTIQVDLSKEFVFVSQPEVEGGESPSAWQIFRFLQEPVKKALFVALGRATQVEKTEATMELCESLDQLWAQEDRFLEALKEMVESEEAREKGLACLMKAYEEESLGSSSEMWEFWGTFAGLLMERQLGLSVRVIL